MYHISNTHDLSMIVLMLGLTNQPVTNLVISDVSYQNYCVFLLSMPIYEKVKLKCKSPVRLLGPRSKSYSLLELIVIY